MYFIEVMLKLFSAALFAAGAAEVSADTVQTPCQKQMTFGCTPESLMTECVDVVAYFSLKPTDPPVLVSDEKYTAMHNGYTFRFSSQENRDLFAADPWAFAPQYGGF